MIIVYPFALIGVDIRRPMASLLLDLGLLIFVLGTLAWFYASSQKRTWSIPGSSSRGTLNIWAGLSGAMV